MDQALALEILLGGENVLLTGAAGSGKTHLLNRFIREAKKQGKHVSVTATTGLAATHLGGSTIHSWSGIGIHDSIGPDFHEYLSSGRRDTIEATDVLIIDEISMLHDFRLDMVNQIAKQVRDSDEPFGGIQVVLCGDFFQLPPINRQEAAQGSFVVNSVAWEELDPVICYLSEQHRQNDDALLEILSAMRGGDVRRRHAEALLERVDADTGDGEVTQLHTTNVDVDSINNQHLAQLTGKPHVYHMTTTGKANYVENLKRSCLAPEELVLKKGALVMCIKNSPDKKFVNGSLGIVVGFDKETGNPEVELKAGRRLVIAPDSWELRDGEKKRASLAQLPLRLAWAITVHKSQGMTLDAARIDLRRAFVEGMGYVAISRVRSLETLSLVGLNRMALQVSAEALRIDEELRRKSAGHAKQFAHLREKATTRKPDVEKKPASGWTDKLAKMRQKYPNAYKPWSRQDDEKLVGLFSKKNTVTINELTELFGRHPGSIRSRLKKHFGDDAVTGGAQ